MTTERCRDLRPYRVRNDRDFVVRSPRQGSTAAEAQSQSRDQHDTHRNTLTRADAYQIVGIYPTKKTAVGVRCARKPCGDCESVSCVGLHAEPDRDADLEP